METFGPVSNLNILAPANGDLILEGDDHIRGIKKTLKFTFPGLTGAVSPEVTHTYLTRLAEAIHVNGSNISFVKPMKSTSADLSMSNYKITGVRDGTDPQDVVNRRQLDDLLARIVALENK